MPSTEPRRYWLIVTKSGDPREAFNDEDSAKKTHDYWDEPTYRIIQVQEVPNE